MIIHPGFVGIDISKTHLDLFDAGMGQQRCANAVQPIADLIERWKDTKVFVLFEATGHYDAALRRALAKARIPFALQCRQRTVPRPAPHRRRQKTRARRALHGRRRRKPIPITFRRLLSNPAQGRKPPKLAFIALARKILITLNAILRDKIAFQP